MAKQFKINGLAALQKKLERLPGKVKQSAIEEIEDCADRIVMKAVADCPVDLGGLKQSIGNEPKNGGLNYIVFVDKEYAPYVEFGKGSGLEVPSELISYASTFKKGGNSNMKAQPFFFPAFFSERDNLIKALRESIAKHLK